MESSQLTSWSVYATNEWDKLEEVILGDVQGARFPAWTRLIQATCPPRAWECLKTGPFEPGAPYPAELIDLAQEALQRFAEILRSAGVNIRRPSALDFGLPIRTPYWSVPSGMSAANPRDVLFVYEDEIVEAPMADRNRYYEVCAYRDLLHQYFDSGCRWTAAPRPRLMSTLYRGEGFCEEIVGHGRLEFSVTEEEPVFDAADAVRADDEIFIQRSHVTNAAGISWLRRHLQGRAVVRVIESAYPYTMHIDTTFLPLAPGRALVNPEFVNLAVLADQLADWELLVAPEPLAASTRLGTVSKWINVNVLVIRPGVVVAEASQTPLLRALEKWGFTPVPCHFADYYPFGGSSHCAALDIRPRPARGVWPTSRELGPDVGWDRPRDAH